ncbi:MAG: 4-(cytidine 5'-diphospho)-2-C-methyl-D-erythritol kinase [Candidatus Omnitrophica bacterium]|nr:4-(cytidine 5'-diphospho)-2-C-methyl-D-erythritol kinase [Candidatus Omnitrophota bacterium]
MRSIILSSPAKLNLFLKVLEKRSDGYHGLKTVFERISLCDDIRFKSTKSDQIKITCDHPHVPVGPKNLVYQVAQLLRKDYGIEKGVEIDITKRIPVAAGLAGGSSNAATALLGLNRLWGINLTKKTLIEYGKRVGSDVPFFLHDCSWGLGTHRGDHIKPLSVDAKMWHILVVPRIKMYSGEVFARFKMKLTKQGDDVNILLRSLRKCNIYKVTEFLSNDLEQSILQIRPGLIRVKKRLESFLSQGVCFSGSGPAVFGITSSKKEAENIKAVLKKRYSQVFVVQTL